MTDHYHTLQVARNADPEVVERAYKALSLKYHPDRATARDQTRATKRMQRINAAYAVLRDPEARTRYDRSLPSEGAQAWDQFWSKGLVGLFLDRFADQPNAR